MKIVILSGGTGSIALQTGLASLMQDRVDANVKIIVNAYDNGLSTGAVRKVVGGKILGPSDVRKNQTTMYSLKSKNVEVPVLDFFNCRFTIDADSAEDFCLKKVRELRDKSSPYVDRRTDELEKAVKAYFDSPTSRVIDYDDFALANIVYAGLAILNGNSIRAAATIIADLLAIPDTVMVNDDTSLFLGAITKSGKKITDEGDIVSWNNPDDPIIDVFFTDEHGNPSLPILNEESTKALEEADLIVLSSGTQWSSLIPTYASMGFKEAIARSNAKVVMVMNRVPDKDAPDQSASDIINTLVPKYFPKDRLDVILDNDADEIMRSLDKSATGKVASVNTFNLGSYESKTKHAPAKLAHAVLQVHFLEYLNAKAYVLDYDDTIVGRGNSFPKSSQFNTQSITMSKRKMIICTGNSIKAVQFKNVAFWHSNGADSLPFTVFADGGINEYSYDPCSPVDEEQRKFRFVRCLDENAKFDSSGENSVDNIIKALCAVGIPKAKIENRGDVMVTIKPIDPEYREITLNLVKAVAGGLYDVRAAGRTTIEINKKQVSKDVAVKEVLKGVSSGEHIVYIGDELDGGNDEPIRALEMTDDRVRCLAVKNPADTAMFFIALNGVNL